MTNCCNSIGKHFFFSFIMKNFFFQQAKIVPVAWRWETKELKHDDN